MKSFVFLVGGCEGLRVVLKGKLLEWWEEGIVILVAVRWRSVVEDVCVVVIRIVIAGIVIFEKIPSACICVRIMVAEYIIVVVAKDIIAATIVKDVPRPIFIH